MLTWSRSGVQITRRVKVDVKTGTLRYVEIFHNPGTAPVTLDVKIVTRLQSSVASVLTDGGQTDLAAAVSLASGSFPPGTSRRMVLFLVDVAIRRLENVQGMLAMVRREK